MLENTSKINYLCDVKEIWSNFVITYVLVRLNLINHLVGFILCQIC